jgi:LruC domain-containing protein
MKHSFLYLSLMFLTTLILFAACDTPNRAIETERGNTDHLELIIPDGFTFETTKRVNATISAQNLSTDGALVEFYNADPSKNGQVVERVFVKGGDTQTATLHIPSYLENVWMVSRASNGISETQKLQLTGTTLSAQIGGTMSMASSNLVARYLFNEGTGNQVLDQSGFGSPLNLEFGSGVDWIPGRNGVEITSSSAAIRSNAAATKVFDELTGANEFTIEVWGNPANLSQTGPARMVSMSDGSSNRNFTFGQGPFGGSGEDMEFRLRTTTTNNNAFPGNVISNVVTLSESHYVVTWDGSELKYYQDGVLEATIPTSGDLSNWNAGYELILGNETDLTRPWLGELYQVSIYSEALDETDILANYAEGSLIPDIYTFENPFPADGVFGTLAYEDLWPSFGDYDMNDLVVDLNVIEDTDLNNEIHQIRFSFAIRALGAAFDSGFGIELPVPYSQISEVSGNRLTKGLITENANGTEAGHSNAVIIMWDDSADEMGKWVNTINPADHVDEDSLFVTVKFDTPVSRSMLGEPPYKPFVFINEERGREVHLPGNAPTELVNTSYFGQEDDTTDPGMGRFYLSDNDLNWAFFFPVSVDYPLEKVSILQAFPDFAGWVQSGGMANQDWYLPANRDNSKVYVKP